MALDRIRPRAVWGAHGELSALGAEGNLCIGAHGPHRSPPLPLGARQLLGSGSPWPHPGASTEPAAAPAGTAWLVTADASLLSDAGDISRVPPPPGLLERCRMHPYPDLGCPEHHPPVPLTHPSLLERIWGCQLQGERTALAQPASRQHNDLGAPHQHSQGNNTARVRSSLRNSRVNAQLVP